MACPDIALPASRVNSLMHDQFSLDFLDEFLSEDPGMDFILDFNDTLGALIDSPFVYDTQHPIFSDPPNPKFAIHICTSAHGSPPKLTVDRIKVPGCPGDCAPNAPETMNLATQLSAAAARAVVENLVIPFPSSDTDPFEINAIVFDGQDTLTLVPLTVTPHDGAKSRLGNVAQCDQVARVLGEMTGYVSVFAEYKVLFITRDTGLMPSLIQKLGIKSTPIDQGVAAVFFKALFCSKALCLSDGKYNFLFTDSATVQKSPASKRKREEPDAASIVASLRACVIDTKIDTGGVLAALASFPVGCLDMDVQERFKRKLGVAGEKICLDIVVQLANFLENYGFDEACAWVKHCGVF